MPPVPARPAAAVTARLAVGDTVSVAVGVFGEEYARSRGASPWFSEAVRDNGVIIGRDGQKWRMRFADGVYSFERKALVLEKKAAMAVEGAGTHRAAARETRASDSDEEEPDDNAAAQAQQPVLDSSDEDIGPGAPEHEGGRAQTAETHDESGWIRDDHYAMDERARHRSIYLLV